MTRRMRLSDRGVARLRPETGEYTVWDTVAPGLGVRVRASGHRAFVCLDRRGGAPRRRTLGPAALMDVAQARALCRDIRFGGETGSPPEGGTAPRPLFRDFVATTWKAECLDRCKPSARHRVRSVLGSQLLPAFGGTALDGISRRDVERWFDRYSATAPGGANAALGLLGQVMNHAMVHGHVRANPARGIRRNPRRPRTRFLSADEVRRLHAELDRCVAERPSRRDQADVIRLLLLTGCRRGEILNLRWEEVGDGALDLADSKTGPRRAFLNSAAEAVLARRPRTGGPWVFPSPRDPSRPLSRTLALWPLLRRRAGIEDARLHDLRHTVASHAVLRGVPLPVVARLLGHSRVSMTLRYAHVRDREVEEAAERIGKAITALCGGSRP